MQYPTDDPADIGSLVPRAAQALGMDALDLALLLLLAAPDLDVRYGRLFGYLQDDLTQRRPSPDLLSRLLAETAPQRALVLSRLRIRAPLHAWGVLADTRAAPHLGSEGRSPWLGLGLRLDPMWLNWLQGLDGLDAQTAEFARVFGTDELALGPQALGKGGIVRDENLYPHVEEKIRTAACAEGFEVRNYFASSIAGGDGNKEFFIYAVAI